MNAYGRPTVKNEACDIRLRLLPEGIAGSLSVSRGFDQWPSFKSLQKVFKMLQVSLSLETYFSPAALWCNITNLNSQ